jgi:hypothetical protein
MQIANSITIVISFTDNKCKLHHEILTNLFYMKNLIRLFSLLTVAGFILTSCEGPMGQPGKDANESCTLCHNSGGVDSVKVQYDFSKHSYGEAAFEEAGNTGCTPCHSQEAFLYVCANNTPTTFSIATGATTYSNNYATTAGNALGEFGCKTCHKSLHSTFTDADYLPLTTTKGVAMTFTGGATTIDLTQKGGESNLCVKCHQPRPFARSNGDKNVIDYAALKNSPTTVFFDGSNPNSTANINTIKAGYRTHTHYGTAGAIFAGKGGIEFGTGYSNSWHTTGASCQDCHMAPVTGRGGGHTFFAKGNFNGCNVTGCHSTNVVTYTSTTVYSAGWTTYYKNPRAEIQTLLNQLAAKLVYNGVDILNRNPNATEGAILMVNGSPVSLGVNLWAGATTNNYDGYLNVFDPVNNPAGPTYNNGASLKMFQNYSAPATPGSGWTQADINFNATLPKILLTNAQFGAIINFQLVLRDYSLGVHNTKYVRTLLTNSIAAI